MKYLPLLSCIVLLVFFACNEVNPKGEKEVREFVIQWNDAHTQLKSPYLERYYMDVVNYYDKERTRNQVQQDKNWLFQKFPDYTQQILNNQIDITKEAGNFLITFTKHVNYNGIASNHTTYLSVIRKNRTFKILREAVAKDSKTLEAPIYLNALENNINISDSRQLFGDFNGDGLSDYASVIPPKIILDTAKDSLYSNEIPCEGECKSVIIFSSKDLKAITILGAYKSQLENLKDLNNDGSDDIGFWDIKPKTKTLNVYNAVNGELLCKPIVINTEVHKNLNLIDVFKKTGPNKITISSSVQEDGKWILKSEVITLD